MTDRGGDLAWLAERIGVSRAAHVRSRETEDAPVSDELTALAGASTAGVLVEPTGVSATVGSGERPVIALIGWPTGRHHSLIKAAEARLAVDDGADEVWLAVDSTADSAALLADIIAVSQVVEAPARLGVVCGTHAEMPELRAAAHAAEQAGVAVLALQADQSQSSVATVTDLAATTSCQIAVFGEKGAFTTIDAVVDVLWAGATRVYLHV